MQTSPKSFLALASLAALGLAAAPAHAGGTTINFDGYTAAAQAAGGAVNLGPTVDIQGFTLTSSTSFFALDGSNPNYGDGETSLYSNGAASTMVIQDNGNPFSFNAIDLGHVPAFTSQVGNVDEPYTFTGTQVGGGTVTQTVDQTSATGFSTFAFTGFTNLTSLSFAPVDSTLGNPLQFDNIQLNQTAPVPEASSTVSLGLMLALGLGGVAVMRRRKTAAGL